MLKSWKFFGATLLLMLFAAVAVMAQAPAKPAGAKPAAARPAGANAMMAKPAPTGPVVMRINGQDVHQSEYDDMVQRMMAYQAQQMGQMGQEPKPEDMARMRSALEKEAHDQIIGKTLFDQGIAEVEKKITDDQVTKRMAEVDRLMKAEGTSLADQLKEKNMTEADLRQDLKRQLALVALVQANSTGSLDPKEDEIKAFFEKNKDKMNQPEIRTSHILIGYPERDYKPTDQEKAEYRKKAEAALARVKGGEDFAKVASEVSTCPSKAKGGDLGFNAKGVMVPEFDAAAWKLKEGEISGVVETPFGFHVIKLTGKKEPAAATLASQHDQISEMLKMQKVKTNLMPAVEAMRKKAKIEDFTTTQTAKSDAAPAAAKAPAAPAPAAKDGSAKK